MVRHEEYEPITARPGTTEFDVQFDRQSRWAASLFWSNPLVRVFCGVFGVGLAVLVTSEIVELMLFRPVQLRETIDSLCLCVSLTWLIVHCGRVAWAGRIR